MAEHVYLTREQLAEIKSHMAPVATIGLYRLFADLEAMRAEWDAAKKLADFVGPITPCVYCDGSGKNAHGDCCRIPGHARECKCLICQWKTAHYRQEQQLIAAKSDVWRLRSALEDARCVCAQIGCLDLTVAAIDRALDPQEADRG